MTLKRICCLFLLLLYCLTNVFFVGCWSYREVEELAIVTGATVDKEEGQYKMTFEIVDVEGGTESKIKSSTITVHGVTMFEASRNAIDILGKRLYWSHCKLIVLSEQIARDGLVQVLDFLARDAEIRQTLNVVVSKEKTAEEILKLEHPSFDIVSIDLNFVFRNQKSVAKVPVMEEWELLQNLARPGLELVLPVAYLIDDGNKKIPTISGTAVFHNDRLRGYLTPDETRIFLFIRDQIKASLFPHIIMQDNKPVKVTLEITENHTKLKPVVKDDCFTIHIKTLTKGAMAEMEGASLRIDEEGSKKIGEAFGKHLEEEIEKMVKYVQDEFGCDIFGFGNAIRMNYPKEWKKVQSNWEKVFKTVEVVVESEVIIENTAIQSKPIVVRD